MALALRREAAARGRDISSAATCINQVKFVQRVSDKSACQRCRAFSSNQRLDFRGSSYRRLPEPSSIKSDKAGESQVAEQVQVLESGYGAKNILWSILAAFVLGTGYFYVTDTRAGMHRYISVPLMRALYPDAEDSHHAGVRALKFMYQLGLHPRERSPKTRDHAADAVDLNTEILGITLNNPIGISAGLDKHGEVPSALLALGPGIVEIGGVTPNPQTGNPRPRVWRIPSQDALINCYGLNSVGADAVARELRLRVHRFARVNGLTQQKVLRGEAGVQPGSLEKDKLLAVQIAKQGRTLPQDLDAVVRDYEVCARKLAPYADVLVLNVSSPNTTGLRNLQQEEALTKIVKGVVDAAEEAIADITIAHGDTIKARVTDELNYPQRQESLKQRQRPAVMVKVSPDEDSDAQIAAICASVCNSDAQGVIVANTTTSRPTSPVVIPATASIQPQLESSLPTPSPSIDSQITPYISPSEALTLTQRGGYSGPLTFPHTLSLVQRYRHTLDSMSMTTPESSPSSVSSIPTSNDDNSMTSKDEITSILNTNTTSTSGTDSNGKTHSSSSRNSSKTNPKLIFASGGIITGVQAQQVLNAGANVAMVYTAMVYGGLGTVTRMKHEMEDTRRMLDEGE